MPGSELKSAREFLGEDFDKATAHFRPENRGLTRESMKYREARKRTAREALEEVFSDVAPNIRTPIIEEAMRKLEVARSGEVVEEDRSFRGGLV